MCEEQQSRYVQTFIGSKTKLSGSASNLAVQVGNHLAYEVRWVKT